MDSKQAITSFVKHFTIKKRFLNSRECSMSDLKKVFLFWNYLLELEFQKINESKKISEFSRSATLETVRNYNERYLYKMNFVHFRHKCNIKQSFSNTISKESPQYNWIEIIFFFLSIYVYNFVINEKHVWGTFNCSNVSNEQIIFQE